MDELQDLFAAFVAEVVAAPEGGGADLEATETVEKLERLLGSAAAAEWPALAQFGSDPPNQAER